MNIPTLPRYTKTFLKLLSFTVVLLATTLLPIFSDLPPAAALTDTYPTSIAGCRYASGSPSGYSTCDLKDSAQDLYFDPWSEYNRECTSYVAWMLASVNGFTMPFHADAVDWGTIAAAAPYNYTVNKTPAIGSVYWNTSIDHVGWVQNVSTDGTQVTYQDYNFDLAGHYGDRTVATSSASGYIHFKDVSGSGGTTSPGLGGGNASSWASGRLDAWIEQATPTNGSNLGHIWFNGAWQPWETIPGSQLMASQPAAVSWGVNRIDVFAASSTSTLIHNWFDGSWHNWEDLGGCIFGPPTVTSWGTGRLDVFGEACTTVGGSNLAHIYYNSSLGGWQPWETIAETQVMSAAPSAVAWGSGRIDVFANSNTSTLLHTWYDVTTGGWHGYESLGGCVVGAPAASSWGTGRIDAWVQGCNTTGGNFYQTWWSAATGWSSFNQLSSTYRINGVLGAVSWGSNRIDMFTRASDNSLDHWWFDGTSFQGPENKGGAIAP